jgi:hypothetical protein
VAGWWFLLSAVLVALVGCSAHVPVEGLEFSREEKVVLTFDDGSTVTGRIDNGESVIVVDGESMLKGVVESVDESEIVVADIVTLADDSAQYQIERLRSYRLYVDEDDQRLILTRDRILQVDRVVTDRTRTIRQVIFWTAGITFTLLAVGDRNY